MTKVISAKSRIAKYRAERDFAKTTEPAGKKAVPSSSTLRFVIQRHDARRLHYDFRLELNGVFKSTAVTRGLSPDPHNKRLAVEVEYYPSTTAISKAPSQGPNGVGTSTSVGPRLLDC